MIFAIKVENTRAFTQCLIAYLDILERLERSVQAHSYYSDGVSPLVRSTDDTIYRRSSISNNRSAVYRFVRISIQQLKLDRSYFRSIITIVTSQCKFQGNRPFFTFLASYVFEKTIHPILFPFLIARRTLKQKINKISLPHIYIITRIRR